MKLTDLTEGQKQELETILEKWDCPECEGEGHIWSGEKSVDDCPKCNGTGIEVRD